MKYLNFHQDSTRFQHFGRTAHHSSALGTLFWTSVAYCSVEFVFRRIFLFSSIFHSFLRWNVLNLYVPYLHSTRIFNFRFWINKFECSSYLNSLLLVIPRLHLHYRVGNDHNPSQQPLVIPALAALYRHGKGSRGDSMQLQWLRPAHCLEEFRAHRREQTLVSHWFFLEKRDLTKWRNEFFPALSFVDSPRYAKTSYCIPSLRRFLVSSFLQIFDANRFRILEIPKTFPEPLFVFYLLRKH